MVRGKSVPLSTQLDSGGRIASLDGLRAASIALVVGYHAVNAATQVKLHRDYSGPWQYLLNGELGVSIFFVISGFLITHLLLRETRKTGTINLLDFYIRRTFRIWPAFFFYLGAIVLLYWFHVIGIARRDVVAAGAFVYNYVPHVGNPLVAHSWSLSVEEQFYLFWPVLLLALGSRRATVIALVIVLVCPVIRFSEILLLPASNMFIVRMWEMTHTRIDTLMFGCLIALTADREKVQRAIDRCFALRLHWLAVAYIFFQRPFLLLFLPYSVRAGIGYTLQGVSIMLLIVWLVRYAQSPAGRVFNNRALVHLGAISYSLYLWNPIFCVPQNKTWTGVFPANVFCSIAMAEVSYFAIEQPFLRMRSRFFAKHKPAPQPAN